MSEMKITEDQWLAELQALEALPGGGGPAGFTMRQYAAHEGCGLSTARVRLRKRIDAGQIEYAGDRPEQSLDNRPRPVPVYRVVKGKAKDGNEQR
jgi:hypothetical protein